MTRTRWAAVAALFFALTLAGSATAAADHPTLVVTATHVGDEFVVSGCGYRTGGREVYIYLYRESDETLLSSGAHFLNPDGCFTWATGYVFAEPGDYAVYSFLTKGTTGVGSYSHNNHPLVDYDFTITASPS